MANSSEHIVYVFDSFKLDRARLMLYRGEKEVPLPPKAIETLAILVERRGEIVSKSELIEGVWKDSFVEDSNLSHYLYLLRKAIGNRSDGKPYIETLRKRGYRFDPVELEVEAASNGVGQSSAGATSKILNVERHGNVLALADWRDTSRTSHDDGSRITPTSTPPSRSWSGLTAVALVSIGILLSISAVLFVSRSGTNERDIPREKNVLRLTNGIEVVAATISPDGKYFVYNEPDGKLNRIWLQQTGHATRHEIVPASERTPLAMTFTPDGQHIYFIATEVIGEVGDLYRVPTLGGPVTRILTEVHSGLSFSPDGREIVYYRFDKDGARHVIRASDGSGEDRLLHSATPGYGSSAWSPDGRLIAIVLGAKNEQIDRGCRMAAVEVETGKLIEFSDEVWDGCARIEWSPDGRGVYMIGTRKNEVMTTQRDQVFHISYPQGKSRKITSDGNRHQWSSLGVTRDGSVLTVPFNRSSQIWALASNGDTRTATQITFGQADGRAGVAPLIDGRVAYIARTGESLNIWVMNTDGSDQRQITDFGQGMEELRSGGDGRYLLFSGYLSPPRPHIFRINSDGSDVRQLTAGDTQEVDSSMSHDGKWIVYDSVKFEANKAELSLWKQPIDGGERISLNRNDCQMPHYSPDDKYISCVRDQKDILILSPADGTLITTIRVPPPVTVSNSINFGARWTPDGKAVAYVVNDKGVSNIWTHPIDGSPPKQLTDFSGGSIYHFAYSLDGKRLFVARGYQIRDAVLIREIDQ